MQFWQPRSLVAETNLKCRMLILLKNPLFSKRSELRDRQNSPITREKPSISDPGEFSA
jgi:hypothetical protein